MNENTLPDTLHTITAPALFGTGKVNEVLEQIEQSARALVVDISTAKGRKECASIAAKVARSKTYLDGLDKDYVADIKARAGIVDAERRKIRDTLDALRREASIAAERAREELSAAIARAKAEEVSRQQDQAHALQVRREARDDLVAATKVSEDHAEKIIRAIHKSLIRHIAIQY
jgi:colicin import membrane protein